MKYFVTIKVEETLVIDDVCNEAEAIKDALQQFDASANDPEVVEVWSD
jgi:orotate phosphoribosyltransferase-like protein